MIEEQTNTNTNNTSISALAKLVGPGDLCYYLLSTDVSLGRSTQGGGADIMLGPNKAISRLHAKITYSNHAKAWEFTCISRNGAFVNGMFVGLGYAPVILHSRSLVQIGDKLFFFLLPISEESKGIQKSWVDDEPELFSGVFSYPEDVKGTEDNPAALSVNLNLLPTMFNWKRGSKERFKKSFLTWGFGRWTKVLAETAGSELTVEQVQLFALCFMKQIQVYLETDEDTALKTSYSDMIKRISRCGYFPEQSEDPALTEWNTIQKNAKTWAGRLILLFILKCAMDKYGESHLFDGISALTGKPLTSSWTQKHDLHLLIGVHRHGFNNFRAILDDPNLMFYGNFREDASSAAQEKDEDDIGTEAPAPSIVPSGPVDLSMEIWPSVLALGGRFKRLMDQLKARDDFISEPAIGASSGSSAPAKKKAKTERGAIITEELDAVQAAKKEEQRLRKLQQQRDRRERLRLEKEAAARASVNPTIDSTLTS